jgi:peptidoglycan-associated lipoprotein
LQEITMLGRVFRFGSLLFSLVLVLTIVACGDKKPPAAPPPPPPPPAPVAGPPPPPPPQPKPQPEVPPATPPRQPTEDEIFAKMSVEQINAQKPLATVLFEYDKADLTDQTRAILQKNAEWMRRWASTRVTVEGHADSRGTSEYNLALGERRAAAVKDYLVSLGITGDRLTIVSKGEEEPTCRDEAETCWSQNRRGVFLVTAK